MNAGQKSADGADCYSRLMLALESLRKPSPLRALGGALIAAMISIASPALADVGPPPSCTAGTHHEYLQGHRCVADGSHLEKDPNGAGVKIVADTPAPSPSARGTAMASAQPSSPSPAPAAKQGCAFVVAPVGATEGAASAVVGALVVLAASARRRRSPR